MKREGKYKNSHTLRKVNLSRYDNNPPVYIVDKEYICDSHVAIALHYKPKYHERNTYEMHHRKGRRINKKFDDIDL